MLVALAIFSGITLTFGYGLYEVLRTRRYERDYQERLRKATYKAD